MENEISNEYIENAVIELAGFFGIKEPINGEKIISLVKNGKVEDGIKLIARQLGLPININITDVQNDYGSQGGQNQFHSNYLVKTNKDGKGSEGITAQVNIPSNLPFYGTPALSGFPINVKISNNCVVYPEAFCVIMAHELSHILLYSLNHIKKENEFYTDLVAILLGFQKIFRGGRKTTENLGTKSDFLGTTTTTQTTTYGYLSDTQFNFAINKINSLLKINESIKEKLIDKKNNFNELLYMYKEKIDKFKLFLNYLLKNHEKKFSNEDSKKIINFFQPCYLDSFNLYIEKQHRNVENCKIFIKNSMNFNEEQIKQSDKYFEDLSVLTKDLKHRLDNLKSDIKILKKYIDYLYKIKIFFR